MVGKDESEIHDSTTVPNVKEGLSNHGELM